MQFSKLEGVVFELVQPILRSEDCDEVIRRRLGAAITSTVVKKKRSRYQVTQTGLIIVQAIIEFQN